MSTDLKLLIGSLLTILVIIGIAIGITQKPVETTAIPTADLLADSAQVGNNEAKVVLVEFSDFECPACKAYKVAIDDLLKNHSETLLFAYRHFPLPQHEYAKEAAYAFEASAKQGKQWDTYHYLFASQDKFSKDFFKDIPNEIQLDKEQYLKDLESDEIKSKVDADLTYAFGRKLSSTPSFFMNGVKISPNSPKNLIEIVEAETTKQYE